MPTSRHRKINRARKRARGPTAPADPGPQTSRSRNVRIGAIVLVALLAVSAVAYVVSRRGSQTAAGPEVTTSSGLKYVDLKVGDGATPKPGQTVTVHYIGALANGTEFNNSYKDGQPVDFRIGVGAVIKGWDEGLMTMKVGGKRKFTIPSDLGYGAMGRPPMIPPNSTLVFDVELLGVK